MSRVSFANPGAPVVETEAPTPEKSSNPTSAEQVENGVADNEAVSRSQSFIFNEDEVSFGDIKFPQLHIVQGVGQLSNIFGKGEIILNLQCPIYTPPTLNQGVIVKAGTEPLFVVTVGFRKDRYAEQVANGSDEQGALCDTLEQVAKLNGTINWAEDKKKKDMGLPSRLFKTLATALFLVRKPTDLSDPDHILFPFVCEETYYVLATFNMKGGAFTNGAQPIRQAKKIGHLRDGGYSSFSYSFGTLLKQWQTGNATYIPVMKPGTKTSDGLRAFIKQITGG